MNIVTAEFVVSAAGPRQYPPGNQPEIAFVGRSNVGKSSLINTLCNRRGLARTSATPGKTQLINFYHINQRFFLVDLPGYGYAKVSKAARRQWGDCIEAYLGERRQLALVMQLVDIRHEPTADDVMMYGWLREHNLPVCIVATKADKISRGRWPHHIKIIQEKLALVPPDTVTVFSAVTREGRDELLTAIAARISQPDAEMIMPFSGFPDQGR